MKKIYNIAVREILATVLTKGFLLGIIMPPLMMATSMILMPLLASKETPKVTGHVAVIDATGEVAPRLAAAFSSEALRQQRDKRQNELVDAAGPQAKALKQAPQAAAAAEAMKSPVVSTIALKVLPPETKPDDAKSVIRQELAATGKNAEENPDQRLALIVVGKAAVFPEAGKEFTGFELFTAPRLDSQVRDDIIGQVRDAIVDARITSAKLDPRSVRAMTKSPEAAASAITSTGESKHGDLAKFLIPFAFMMLLWICVFTCGQYLLSSTIEEKSNRVIEVLLSAVSPMELMTGKILGQMCVGSLMLALYGSAGVFGLIFASSMDFLDPINLVYLAVYFLIAFALIACMMAAVGSAVNDVREAQSLLGPIMLMLFLPLMFSPAIITNPNSAFAQVTSFIPPMSPFVMVLRIAGSEKIPTWQIPASIVVGFISVGVFLWATAKIFRIGVLMYGKPPNIGTLIRWIKMA